MSQYSIVKIPVELISNKPNFNNYYRKWKEVLNSRMNPNIPHKAVINISFSIYPVGPTGELTGQTVHRSQLNKDGLKHCLLDVKGNTYEECVTNLKEMLEKITNCKKENL